MKNIFAKKTIRTKKSLGTILLTQRKKRKISLDKAELDTKIRLKYLVALEQDDYKNMAADVYMQGFLRRYCNYLKIDFNKCIKRHIQEKEVYEQLKNKKFSFHQENKKLINPGDKNKYQEKLKFVVTPQFFLSFVVAVIVCGILGYIWFQVKSFAAAPELSIDNPNEQIMVSTDEIDITGQTDENALLFINEQEVAIKENGKFDQSVKLEKGINEIQIKAKNKANKQTIKNIKILVINEEGQEGEENGEK